MVPWLSIDDVKLRNKNWVETLPKGPGNEDVNAIESEFFILKGKAKTCHYLPNKVLDLYLGISYMKWCEIDDYIEEYNTNSVLVCYQFTCVHLNSHEPDWAWLFQKKMSLWSLTQICS